MREEAQEEDDCHLILKAVILIAIFGADFQPMGVECLHSWETNRFSSNQCIIKRQLFKLAKGEETIAAMRECCKNWNKFKLQSKKS